MNIGIYGGTFDPPHLGHLITAETVRTSLRLDSILFIPSYISPHKQQGEERTARHRWEMTRLAVEGNPAFSCADIELRRQQTSYTITTVETLHREMPGVQFTLIIGMDNYRIFHEWKEPQRLLTLCRVAVMNRPGVPGTVNELIGTTNITFTDVPHIGISASMVRDRVLNGQSIRYLVPLPVEEYIVRNGLYR